MMCLFSELQLLAAIHRLKGLNMSDEEQVDKPVEVTAIAHDLEGKEDVSKDSYPDKQIIVMMSLTKSDSRRLSNSFRLHGLDYTEELVQCQPPRKPDKVEPSGGPVTHVSGVASQVRVSLI